MSARTTLPAPRRLRGRAAGVSLEHPGRLQHGRCLSLPAGRRALGGGYPQRAFRWPRRGLELRGARAGDLPARQRARSTRHRPRRPGRRPAAAAARDADHAFRRLEARRDQRAHGRALRPRRAALPTAGLRRIRGARHHPGLRCEDYGRPPRAARPPACRIGRRRGGRGARLGRFRRPRLRQPNDRCRARRTTRR